MSIRTAFNPLGTLGRAKRPFPLVCLTSNTAGSTVDGGPLPTGFKVVSKDNDYKILDGDTDAYVSFDAGSSVEIDFGTEVGVTSVRACARLAGLGEGPSRYWTLQAYVSGAFIDVSNHVLLPTYAAPEWRTAETNGNVRAQLWRLTRSNSNNACIYEVEYTAFY